MLTPGFELFQDDTFVTVVIRAPFTKISETEIFIEGTDFKFYSKPYFLRLCLPGRIVEDGRETATYDADKGTFTVVLPKEIAGEWFDGLDMLTKLLAPKGCTSAKLPTIEVNETESGGVGDAVVEADDDVDWYVEQKPVKDEVLSAAAPKYGFGNLRSGVFTKLQAEFCELIDVKDPDSLSVEDRSRHRVLDEDETFDDDHYLADLHQNDEIQSILLYKPPWLERFKRLKQGDRKEDVVLFTEAEKEKMKNLSNKEYMIEKCDLPSVYLGLVDIMFAYAYNHRITEGENNVESGWTICKLSATLSWLEVFSSVKDVLLACFRRSLCYPLYRHWEIVTAVQKDVACLFSLGRHQLLKCLLEMQVILMATDQRYILNDLYITDYCTWIQSASQKKLESLAKVLEETKIEKKDVGFSLVELETAAEMVLQEDVVQKLATTVSSLSIGNVKDSDDDSTDTQSDDQSSQTDSKGSESDDEFSETEDCETENENKIRNNEEETVLKDDGGKNGRRGKSFREQTCWKDSPLSLQPKASTFYADSSSDSELDKDEHLANTTHSVTSRTKELKDSRSEI